MRKQLPNLLWVGFLLGVAYWVLESILHTYVFDSGSLRATLLCESDPNEMWMRVLVTGLLTAFGWISEKLVRSEKHDKERAMQLNRLHNYVDEVSRHLGETVQEPRSQSDPEQGDTTLLDEDEIGKIVRAIQGLSKYLDTRIEGLYALLELTNEINKGVLVEEVLERIYEAFRSVIPYNRIGVALLGNEGRVLTCRWARADYGEIRMPPGFSAPMRHSSLQRIIETGEPRIINDLPRYLEEHPHSKSSKLIVAEGIRSSLTCPLVAVGKPIGFIFFSSREPDRYRNAHSDVFKMIAGQLSVVIDRSQMYEQLIGEKEVSESLLLNVMPERIVASMKAGTRNPVEAIPAAGVLFADIVGFSEVARRFSAESIVQFLQVVFTQFDVLCEKYELEKIKTIGDSYMVFTGRSLSEEQGLLNLARFALEVLSTSARLRYPDGRPLSVRIGIHTGAVFAGVIGQRKFAYDIWGDTVNIAQRLESTGAPGQVHVTEKVCSLLKEEFAFEPSGEMELKGEGRMTTYFMREK